jgi:membrane protease YdiL (CAAX protease family)
MPTRSKSFTSNIATAPVVDGPHSAGDAVGLAPRRTVVWGEILLLFLLLEFVFWTPRSVAHTILIIALLGCTVWFGFRGRSLAELGFIWPSRRGTLLILAIGCGVAVAVPLLVMASGHLVPANPDWPKFKNLWPYVVWAVGQQFLLQSYFYLRFESLLGALPAVLVSSVLFALLHLPNLPLTALTLLGGLFFTEMFRTFRSLYPLAVAHALMGIAIAYSFPDSLMHHMRVGLSYWQFR